MPAQKSKTPNKNKEYFHIYNKGVENRNIFNDQKDYEVFLGFLKDYLTPPPDPEKTKKSFSVNGRTFRGVPHQPKNYFNKVELIAYSLLPDHFHLLVNQMTKSSLERLIRSLCTRYVIYYNKKYQRRGSLFMGPYKSIQIKDVFQLLHLTHYLHREGLKENESDKNENHKAFSSFQEYSGERTTSWIKPNVVLSYFDQLRDSTFEGINNYKNFIETYKFDQKDKILLERIIFESKSEPLVRRDPEPMHLKSSQAKSVEPEPAPASDPTPSPVLDPPLGIFGLTATATVVFVLLFTLGIRNISTSAAQTEIAITSAPTPIPQADSTLAHPPQVIFQEPGQVSGIKDEISVNVSNLPEKPRQMLVITIDGFENINLRQKAATDSGIISKAKDGETFEYISEVDDWYQIKLDDGSAAFVSAKYAEIEEVEKGEDN